MTTRPQEREAAPRTPPAPGPPAVLRLRGVGRRYGMTGPWVLRGVDLAVGEGTLVRVTGANGSGKSTLLRLLAGVEAPSAGRVEGRPERAYVPERFPARLPLTALGYLTHQGRVRGLPGAVAAARAGEWLERFGAARYARTPMAELSKGGSQKVAVAQAMLGDARLLVLDEAWTGLDPAAREVLDRALTERVADGAAVVFVDHDPRRLAGVPDTVWRLSGGGVTQERPEEAEAAPSGARAPADSEGRVRVVAEGPRGAAPPAGLPGRPAGEELPDGATGFTVPKSCVDPLLRALLTARPPWHIRTVGPADGAAGTGRDGGAA